MNNKRHQDTREYRYGKLIIRLQHLHLLIWQVREECIQVANDLPDALANETQELNMKLDRAFQHLNYTVNKWDDMQKQMASEPVIIRREYKT